MGMAYFSNSSYLDKGGLIWTCAGFFSTKSLVEMVSQLTKDNLSMDEFPKTS
jgi:hypothetical protein